MKQEALKTLFDGGFYRKNEAIFTQTQRLAQE